MDDWDIFQDMMDEPDTFVVVNVLTGTMIAGPFSEDKAIKRADSLNANTKAPIRMYDIAPVYL